MASKVFGLSGTGSAIALALATAVFAGAPARDASAESRSFVVSWFTQAINSQDGDCPDGENGFAELVENWRHGLKGSVYTQEQIEAFIQKEDRAKFANRGKIDGKEVNSYANPLATALDGSDFTPKLRILKAKQAYGFNLDGKGEAGPHAFEDPETHEKGVNNEMYRLMGCISSYRNKAPGRSLAGGAYVWESVRDSMPAWLITVEGADLSKDGPATVTFDRAIDHVEHDAQAGVRSLATFRLDTTGRSHNVFKGQIKNGVVNVDPIEVFHMMGDPYVQPEFTLKKAHLRLTLKPDGNLDAIIGGYTPWEQYWWPSAGGAINVELPLGLDLIALYRGLREFADAEPDPKTGVNQSISSAFRIEAVPAFVVAPVASVDGVNKSLTTGTLIKVAP